MFIVDLDKIITMTEINDDSIIKIYEKYIRDLSKTSNKSKVSPNMGYISSISEARISLEKLYNNSNT